MCMPTLLQIHRVELWARIKDLRKKWQETDLRSHRFLQAKDDKDKKSNYAEGVSKLPKKEFVGVAVLQDDAHFVMGAKKDVKMLRLAEGALTFVAPKINFITDSFMVCVSRISLCFLFDFLLVILCYPFDR